MSTAEDYQAWLRRRKLFESALHDRSLSHEEAERLISELRKIQRIIDEMERR